jgi:DNA-binding transcriptional regulator YiaG
VKIPKRDCGYCNGTGKVIDTVKAGAVLKAMRKRMNLTQAVIAKRMDYSVEYVADLEAGRRKLNDILLEEYIKALR